jgi:hypothetical protein
LQYWGVIRGATSERLSTADLWQRIRDFEGARNVTRPDQLLFAVNQMRSASVEQRSAVDAISALAENAVITAAHIGTEINARDVLTRALSPKYYIRYEASIVTAEGESTRWFTLAHDGILPATKGDITAMIGSDIVDSAAEYDFTLTGATGALSITAY